MMKLKIEILSQRLENLITNSLAVFLSTLVPVIPKSYL
jgi:hypothetical protein